jgi:hypothetical protein
MRDQLRPFVRGVCVLLLFLSFSIELARAGALPPCLKAVLSKTGDSLVILSQGENGSTVLSVFPQERWINEKDRITATAVYWTDFLKWSVVLTPTGLGYSCPLALVTDDGEFLLLVSRDNVVAPNSEALRIYRRRDHPGDPSREGPDHGIFVKAIPFTEIWTTEKIQAHESGTDHTPAWFVGDSFDFSADNRELVDTSGKGSISIDLSDGAVLKP